MKKLIFLLAIILMLGCLNTTNWKESPEYSLLQVKDAIEKNDIILFKKHFIIHFKFNMDIKTKNIAIESASFLFIFFNNL